MGTKVYELWGGVTPEEREDFNTYLVLKWFKTNEK